MAIVLFCGGTTGPGWLANKPSTYTNVLTDYAFDATIPTASSDQPMGDGSGWNTYYPTTARTTSRVADTSGGVSPTNVVETLYETGDATGVGKVKFYLFADSAITEFYVALRIKWDSNYEWQPISNKLFFLEPGNIILQSRHLSNAVQRYLSVFIGDTSTDHLPDNNVTITLGDWHTIEYIVKRSTTAGELHVWLDGVKTMTKTSVNVPTTAVQQTLDINDTWGGSGSARTRSSWRWIDHVYIATP